MSILDYSQITGNLFVGKTPYGKDYQNLREKGITLIINMRAEWPSKFISRQKLIEEIWLPSIDSRYFPINQKKLLNTARQAAEEIDKGGNVYVYCRKGRHRSIVMTAAILILRDYNKTTLSKLISKKRPVADMRAVHVAKTITEFERLNLRV